MKTNEYNDPIKEINNIKGNKRPDEFYQPNEYDNSPKEYGSLNGSNKFKKKKVTKTTTLVLVGAVAGGGVIGTTFLFQGIISKSDLNITSTGDDYISFNYQTSEEGLKIKLTDKASIIYQDIDYSHKDNDGYYKGSYTFNSLKSDTEYTVSLDGKTIFGNISRISKTVKTQPRESWKDNILKNINYSSLKQTTAKVSFTLGGEEQNATNWKFDIYRVSDNQLLLSNEYPTYLSEFDINLSGVISESKYRLLVTADILGRRQIVSDSIEDFSNILTPISEFNITLDNSKVNDGNEYRIKLDYVDVYGIYTIKAAIHDINDESLYDNINFQDYHDWGTCGLQQVNVNKSANLVVKALISDDLWFTVYNETVGLYHTTLPEEIIVATDFTRSFARASSFAISQILDLDNPSAYDMNSLTATISIDDDPYIQPFIKTYSLDEPYVVDLINFSNFPEVRFKLTINYKNELTIIYNEIVALSDN